MSDMTPMETQAPAASSGQKSSGTDNQAQAEDIFSKMQSSGGKKEDGENENSLESNPMMQFAKMITDMDEEPDSGSEEGCDSLPKSSDKGSGEDPGAGLEEEIDLEQVATLAAGAG